jgi:hypothetical protein
MDETPKFRTCNACGWVHFGMSPEDVDRAIDTFNAYFDRQPPDTQALFGGRASRADYDRCFRCGGSHKNFRESRPGDVPFGSTIQPILSEDVDIS